MVRTFKIPFNTRDTEPHRGTSAEWPERLVLGDWQFTGMTTVDSGRPFTPIYGTTTSFNSTFPLKAFQTGNPHAGVPAGLQFNPAAYVPIATVLSDPAFAFKEGNVGRNSLRGPNFFEADWELGKTFQITERQALAMRGRISILSTMSIVDYQSTI